MKDADIFEKVKNIEREIRELCDKRYRDGVNDGFDDGYNQGYFDAKGTNDDEISEQRCKSKMTLDEAIKHAEEVAYQKDLESGFDTDNERYAMTDNERANCKKCAEEHRQLAEWLKELKELKEEERREEDDDTDT